MFNFGEKDFVGKIHMYRILLLQIVQKVACPWSVVLCRYSASSTTNTGHHDIAEMALNTKNQTKLCLFVYDLHV